MVNVRANMPPASLAVDDELKLIRTAPLDGQQYIAMLRQDEPKLSYSDLQSANDECFAMYNQMVEGTMLSYWLDHQGDRVGYVGITHVQQAVPPEDYWTMDYWLVSPARGHRLMHRAAKRLLDYGFESNVFTEVTLHIVPTNVRSKSVARSIGAVLVPERSNDIAETWRVAIDA